jgi:hypothetical protein
MEVSMEKINHLKILSQFYSQPKKKISLVEIPSLTFLAIDGTGNPNNNPAYSEAVGALYAIAYKLKFMIKKSPIAVDYKVMPLEGLWWAEDMNLFNLEDRSNWHWRMMIMQPDYVTKDLFKSAFEFVKIKKNLPRLADVNLIQFSEGLCMQIFHQGAYGEGERDTIEKLHNHIQSEGFRLRGRHHEIYLNSPLRTAVENLKTIIRQPIETL